LQRDFVTETTETRAGMFFLPDAPGEADAKKQADHIWIIRIIYLARMTPSFTSFCRAKPMLSPTRRRTGMAIHASSNEYIHVFWMAKKFPPEDSDRLE
jgi:hypothetical protein